MIATDTPLDYILLFILIFPLVAGVVALLYCFLPDIARGIQEEAKQRGRPS